MTLVRLLVLCFVLILLGGCQNIIPAETLPPLPQQPVYIVSTGVVNHSMRTSLTIVDLTANKTYRTIRLPALLPEHPAQDPQKRIWIPFTGWAGEDETLIQIYTPEGNLVKEINPCMNPEAIMFAQNKAFVACLDTGFEAKVAIIDSGSLTVEQTIDITTEQGFTFVSAAMLGENIFLFGQLAMVDSDTPTIKLLALNITSMVVTSELDMTRTHVEQMLVKEKELYLLNQGASAYQGEDIIVFDSETGVTRTLDLVEAPLAGAQLGDQLYLLHNPEYGLAVTDPKRWISRLNITTEQTQPWPLPDSLQVFDLFAYNNEVFIVNKTSGQDHGIYAFDPSTGQLQLRVKVNLPMYALVGR